MTPGPYIVRASRLGHILQVVDTRTGRVCSTTEDPEAAERKAEAMNRSTK